MQINHPLKSVSEESIKAIKHRMMYLAGTYVHTKTCIVFSLVLHKGNEIQEKPRPQNP